MRSARPDHLLRASRRRLRYRWTSDFYFVHINKCGGSSVEKALDLPLRHRTALEAERWLGSREWRRRFTFSFVRNPWDRVVSHYRYRMQSPMHGRSGRPQVPFAEWVDAAYRSRDPDVCVPPQMFMTQSEWLVDTSGAVMVDFVGRFEDLQADFATVCRRMGRPVVELPHLKATKRLPYEEYYDVRTREIVAEFFA